MSEKENVKKVMKLFMPWNFEKEQAWLEEMAREGWLLEKMVLRYTFKKAEPQEMVYRADYFSITDKKKLQTYVSIFEEAGWELIHSQFGWHYFRIPKSEFQADIYSDPPSRIDQLKRINEEALSVFIIYFLFFTVLMDYEHWFDFVLFFPMLAGFIWGIIYMLKINEKIKNLQAESGEEEEPLEIKL